MQNPLISIITPTFNAAATIERAIRSVAVQYFKEIEHLIIDGNSEDDTVEIVHSIQKKYSHIRLICEKDNGIYDAINKGIDLSRGNWLYVLGADDELYNEYVLSDLFDEGIFNKEQVVYGNVIINGETTRHPNGAIYDGPFDLAKLLKKNICQQSIFYPRSTIKNNGYFTTRYETCADWDYNLRCFAKQEFYHVDKIISVFSTGGKSTMEDSKFDDDILKNIVGYFNLDINNENLNDKNSPFFKIISTHLKRYQDTDEKIIEYTEDNTALNNIHKNETGDQSIRENNPMKELQSEIKYNKVLISFSNKKILDLTSRVSNLSKLTSSQTVIIRRQEDKIQNIYHSLTWRIGKILLAPVQYLYKLMK